MRFCSDGRAGPSMCLKVLESSRDVAAQGIENSDVLSCSMEFINRKLDSWNGILQLSLWHCMRTFWIAKAWSEFLATCAGFMEVCGFSRTFPARALWKCGGLGCYFLRNLIVIERRKRLHYFIFSWSLISIKAISLGSQTNTGRTDQPRWDLLKFEYKSY